MYVYNIESKNGYLRCIPQIRTKIVRIVDILGLRLKKKNAHSGDFNDILGNSQNT